MSVSQRRFRTDSLARGAKACNIELLERLWEWDKKNSRAVKLQDVLNERYNGKNSLTRGSRQGPPRGIVKLLGGV